MFLFFQNKNLKNKVAFTLIELLVAIAIVGILSGIVFASMSGAIDSSKDAKRKADLATLQIAILAYFAQNNNTFPDTVDTSSCNIGSTCDSTLATNLQPYLQVLPTGPTSGEYYTYKYTAGATPSIILQTTLSNTHVYKYDSTSGFSEVGYISSCSSGGGLTCTETTDGSYLVYKFTYTTSPGSTTWSAPSGVTSVEYLVVAGGGGSSGSGAYTGGAGGGGVLTGTLSSGLSNLTITVGAGGTACSNCYGTNGGDSVVGSVTAYGGGAGDYSNAGGKSGGCGGGGGGAGGAGGSGTGGQGYAGGSGQNGASASGGAGGGASQAGANGVASTNGAKGGDGYQSSITGTATYYGGGGGGGVENSAYTGGAGGQGGGGTGQSGSGGAASTSGTNGLGGGAGGGSGAIGGSGVVILRFLHP